MAKIPDETTLGARPAPSAHAMISTDTGMAEFGESFSNTARNLSALGEEFQAKEDSSVYAKARADYLQRDFEIRRQLEEDPDYKTWESKYEERMGAELNRISGAIENNFDRERFMTEGAESTARGLQATHRLSRDRDIRVRRGDLDNYLDTTRKQLLLDPDQPSRTETLQAVLKRLQADAAAGIIMADEGAAKGRDFTLNYARGYIEAQDIEEQIAILGNKDHPVTKFLHEDERKNRLEAALKVGRPQQISRDSMGLFDQGLEKFGAYSEKRFANMENWARNLDYSKFGKRATDVRDDLMGRIRQERSDEITRDNETNYFVTNHLIDEIEKGNITSWDEIVNDPYRLKALRPADQTNIKKLLTKGPPSQTNWKYWTFKSGLEAHDPKLFREVDLLEARNEMADEEYKPFARRVLDAREGKPVSHSNILSATQMLRASLGGHADAIYTATGQELTRLLADKVITEEKRRAEAGEVNVRFSDDEMQEMVDDLTVTVKFKRPWYMTDEKKKVYQLEPGDSGYTLTIDEVPPAEVKKINDHLRGAGISSPTAAQVIEKYIEKLELLRR